MNEECEQLQEKLLNMQSALTSISAIDISEEHVQGGKHLHDKIGDAIVRIDECRAKLQIQKAQYEALKNNIFMQIASISNDVYSKILNKRYIQFKKLKVIAVEMNYDYTYIRALHGKALQAFEKEILSCKNV